MNRLEKIRNRFEAFKEGRSTAPLPPDDTAWLIDVADVADMYVKHCTCKTQTKEDDCVYCSVLVEMLKDE